MGMGDFPSIPESLSDRGGYTSLNDVNQVPPPRRNNMESFWLVSNAFGVGHTFGNQLTCRRRRCVKYLYVMFSPSDYLPLSEFVFNTEAHVMPKIRLHNFRTGWQRSQRDK